MPTLNVCVQMCMIKKNTQNHKKYKYFSSVCFFDHDYMIIYIHDYIYT